MDILNIIYAYPLAAVLLVAWLLDVAFGDPGRLPHPVVYMGKWIAFGEKRLNRAGHRKLKGAMFAVLSIIAIGVLTWWVFYLLTAVPLINVALSAFILFFCLAGHTLRREVRMVFEALEQGLDAGRRQVARIVGRDTAELSAQEVRTAALETLAENLSDGVIAPLFWFLVLGVPGAVAYKMINTFDSMVGYKTDRYREFGCWAAHIDDIANFIPARITAFLILIAGGISGRRVAFTFKYGPQHASPNSGWPEAALAAILDCRFGGSHNYFGKEFVKPHIGTNPRPLTLGDMKRSIRICMVAETVFLILSIAILTLWNVTL